MIQTSSSWDECKYLQRGLYFNGLAEHGDQSRNIVIIHRQYRGSKK